MTAPFTQQMARDMSEATLQGNITGVAESLGFLAYHTHDSRRSQPGFPDLVLVDSYGRIIFSELKTERGRQSPPQEEWERRLRRNAGVEFYLWRPGPWLLGEVTQILAQRPGRPA